MYSFHPGVHFATRSFVHLAYDALPKIFFDDLMDDPLLAGKLYLGVFSGPIEGILMIVLIFVITGFHGTIVDT